MWSPDHTMLGGKGQRPWASWGPHCRKPPRRPQTPRKAPRLWVSPGRTMQAPCYGCRGDPGDMEHHRKPWWDHGRRGKPVTPASWALGASLELGEAALDALGPWGRGGWLSPKQDVPLGVGDALRQPFAECPRLLHRPREEEEGREALGSAAPRAAQGRRCRPAGREGAGDGMGCGGSPALR